MSDKNSEELKGNTKNIALDKSYQEIEIKKLELDAKKLEFWEKILNPAVPKLFNYFEEKLIKHETPILKAGIWVLTTIMILIILGTGLLVYLGKLDTASFTFVIGTVLGYLLAFTKIFWKNKE